MAWPFGDTTYGETPWYERVIESTAKAAANIGLKALDERLNRPEAPMTPIQQYNPPITRTEFVRGDAGKATLMIGGVLILFIGVWALISFSK